MPFFPGPMRSCPRGCWTELCPGKRAVFITFAQGTTSFLQHIVWEAHDIPIVVEVPWQTEENCKEPLCQRSASPDGFATSFWVPGGHRTTKKARKWFGVFCIQKIFMFITHTHTSHMSEGTWQGTRTKWNFLHNLFANCNNYLVLLKLHTKHKRQKVQGKCVRCMWF